MTGEPVTPQRVSPPPRRSPRHRPRTCGPSPAWRSSSTVPTRRRCAPRSWRDARPPSPCSASAHGVQVTERLEALLRPLAGKDRPLVLIFPLAEDGLPETAAQNIFGQLRAADRSGAGLLSVIKVDFLEEVIRLLVDTGALARDQRSGTWSAGRSSRSDPSREPRRRPALLSLGGRPQGSGPRPGAWLGLKEKKYPRQLTLFSFLGKRRR